ncbi:uncharacterized protein LOC110752577 [Prunus avium]|uniref:DNA-directed RNA polymerase n=1 Tax=Prunus avium TaxID=42229 RepID=A0A6P5S5Z5_PRUAV|nr:uncharacterized protein LOC110752577 [Prunus avium]XP_021808952.1 uncharacterized protein LOC110752577 [Prunus avium]
MLENGELHFLHILYTLLTGSHMIMIALACRDTGLRFAEDIGTYTLLKCSVLRGLEGIDSSKQGVHDSFWTHACDVDQMNEILREKFVELYSMLIKSLPLPRCLKVSKHHIQH